MEHNFLFEINHIEDVLKISFFLPAFEQQSNSEIDMIEFKFTTGVYTDDSMEFGKFKLYISRYEVNPSNVLMHSNISHTDSALNITFNDFIEKMDKECIVPFLKILKLHFKIGTTYTPTEKEKLRITDSYCSCFTELVKSLQENLSFIPDVSHTEISQINTIIDAHATYKNFNYLSSQLPYKKDN